MNKCGFRKIGFFTIEFYSDEAFRQLRLFVGDKQIYCTPLFSVIHDETDAMLKQMILFCLYAATEAMTKTSQDFVDTVDTLERRWNGTLEGNSAAD